MTAVFTAPILPRAPAARPTLVPTGFPIAVHAPHGDVAVVARYIAAEDAWDYAFPSHSRPGTTRNVRYGVCNCPARKVCWHRTLLPAIQSRLHEIVWSFLMDLRNSGGSVEDAYNARQALTRMGITTRTTATAALAVLS